MLEYETFDKDVIDRYAKLDCFRYLYLLCVYTIYTPLT